jgi:hypothetical protein
MRLALCVLVAGFGCSYRASYSDCLVSCATSNTCPTGQSCMAGYCRDPGATTSCREVLGDASVGGGDAPGGSCVVKTCEQMGYQCGRGWDGCTDVVDCAACGGNSGCHVNDCIDNAVFKVAGQANGPDAPCPTGARQVAKCNHDFYNETICLKNEVPNGEYEYHGSFDPAPCGNTFHEAVYYYCQYSNHRICLKD